MNIFLLSIGFGLVTASVLALAAVGSSLQFGVTNHVNFAYGEFLTLGAYVAWWSYTGLHLNVWVSFALGVLFVGIVGVVTNWLILRPFVRRGVPLLFLLIITFGLSLIYSNVILAVWGSDFQSFNLPEERPLWVGPFIFTPDQLGTIAVAVAAMLGIHLLLTRTKLGKAMRAMSDDPSLALVSGIDTERVTTWTWLIAGCLAGVAGISLALSITSFQPAFGGEFLFVIFSAVILGGIGQPYGAMLGALAIGLATEMSAVLIGGAYKNDVAFALLVVMLLLRPQGLIPARGKG